MAGTRLAKGGIIAGRWVLERELGRGAMGEVWLAVHVTLRQTVAIKILDRGAFPTHLAAEARSRFDLEARVAAKLARKTRHVVRVIDNGRDGDIDYLVMELLEGQSLEERLIDGPLRPSQVIDIVRQAARGLHVAHAVGVIHRDVKPGNLFISVDDDGKPIVKLLDFGIAKATVRDPDDGPPSSHATRAGVLIGTAQYMSPEQARGLSVDARVDVWALAAVAYELLTGRPAFDAESAIELLLKICTTTPSSPRSHRPSLPPAVEEVFARAFAHSIDARHADVRSFADALATALEPDIALCVAPSSGRDSVASYVATSPATPSFEHASRGVGLPRWVSALVLAAIALVGVGTALRTPMPAHAQTEAACPARESIVVAPPSVASAASTSTAPVMRTAPSASIARPRTAGAKAKPTTPAKSAVPALAALPEPTAVHAEPKTTDPVSANRSEIF